MADFREREKRYSIGLWCLALPENRAARREELAHSGRAPLTRTLLPNVAVTTARCGGAHLPQYCKSGCKGTSTCSKAAWFKYELRGT